MRAVAYGTFAPNEEGYQIPPIAQVSDDFGQMRRFHINAGRTYTLPGADLLDEPLRHGLVGSRS